MPSVESIRAVNYPIHLKEIIVVEGENPSLQRNVGVQRSSGEILYFLDDNSRLEKRTIEYLLHGFEDFPDVVGIGGPSIEFEKNETHLQDAIGLAFSSTFGMGPSRSRHFSLGFPRLATEYELILCNFAIKRSIWGKCGEFDARLYPSEENDFLIRLKNHGCKFLYHPLMIVRRKPRENLRQLSRQLFRYGKARSEQIKINLKSYNLLQFFPTLLLIYFISLLIISAKFFFLQPPSSVKAFTINWAIIASWMPTIAYMSLIFLGSLASGFSSTRQRFRLFTYLLVIYPTMHFSYGLGMIIGFFTRLKKENINVDAVVRANIFDATSSI